MPFVPREVTEVSAAAEDKEFKEFQEFRGDFEEFQGQLDTEIDQINDRLGHALAHQVCSLNCRIF